MKSLFFIVCLFFCYSYVVWTPKAEQNFKNSSKAFVKGVSIRGRKLGTTGGGCINIVISNTRIVMHLIGSEPPDCDTERERCAPCKPVLVKVPLDTAVTVGDYYPEVWMCGCSCTT
ncbi:hypothetical protein Salat_0674300 [Sesamum alatum]|uniref:Epidermal patterning factor-like protein n=1 Tax=Sesamum alatum TaxID=300844 RepID=A0AAE2CUM1_9LAMI|nr:hypothetical protein Salat_0674300 [Sesamum alatum]